jgi:hypothetical protein
MRRILVVSLRYVMEEKGNLQTPRSALYRDDRLERLLSVAIALWPLWRSGRVNGRATRRDAASPEFNFPRSAFPDALRRVLTCTKIDTCM